MTKPMLEVQSLTKNFGPITAVKDLSFTVNKGEVFGFLGPNGAGKTTTMRMITNFIPASQGSVRIDGLDTKEYDLEVRKKIGYLPETTPLYNDMLVDEYISFVATLRGLQGTYKNEQVEKMLTLCGLTSMRKRSVGHLSKGYRQRVGLAQALVHEPELLILDEPMSGLDPNQIIEIRALIKEIGKTKTVIYCSHILTEVSATCNRILIIKDGKIAAQGTSDELAVKATQIFDYQIRVSQGDERKVKDAYSNLSHVIEITKQKNQPIYMISSDNEAFGSSLFQCAIDNGFVLSEIIPQATTLEDTFTRLTGSNA